MVQVSNRVGPGGETRCATINNAFTRLQKLFFYLCVCQLDFLDIKQTYSGCSFSPHSRQESCSWSNPSIKQINSASSGPSLRIFLNYQFFCLLIYNSDPNHIKYPTWLPIFLPQAGIFDSIYKSQWTFYQTLNKQTLYVGQSAEQWSRPSRRIREEDMKKKKILKLRHKSLI